MRQSTCCNASFASSTRLKMGAIAKDKILGVYSIFVPNLTYDHKSWAITEKNRITNVSVGNEICMENVDKQL